MKNIRCGCGAKVAAMSITGKVGVKCHQCKSIVAVEPTVWSKWFTLLMPDGDELLAIATLMASEDSDTSDAFRKAEFRENEVMVSIPDHRSGVVMALTGGAQWDVRSRNIPFGEQLRNVHEMIRDRFEDLPNGERIDVSRVGGEMVNDAKKALESVLEAYGMACEGYDKIMGVPGGPNLEASQNALDVVRELWHEAVALRKSLGIPEEESFVAKMSREAKERKAAAAEKPAKAAPEERGKAWRLW